MTALDAQVTRVSRLHMLTGAVYCPRCGARIGRADDPAIAYRKGCTACGRLLAIRLSGAKLFIMAEEDDDATGH